ncbi:MAG: YrbL family protein [Alphaproteobacteria bacterium]|nr:YrbL family protein [Alphaproteobacteria bacterium]
MEQAGVNGRGGARLWRWPPGGAPVCASSRGPVIDLRQGSAFACGYHRDCFVHPEDGNRCIKVSRRGDHRESMREARYYEHLQRRGVPWSRLPRFHGFIETTLGPGAVFDLVRDAGGEISKPLCDYFQSLDLTAKHRRGIVRGLGELRRYLVDHRIVVRTLKPKNLVYQLTDPEDGRLFVVDNIGNTEALPVATHIPFFSYRKINRKWARFEHDLLAEYRPNPLVARIIAAVRRTASETVERAG